MHSPTVIPIFGILADSSRSMRVPFQENDESSVLRRGESGFFLFSPFILGNRVKKSKIGITPQQAENAWANHVLKVFVVPRRKAFS